MFGIALSSRGRQGPNTEEQRLGKDCMVKGTDKRAGKCGSSKQMKPKEREIPYFGELEEFCERPVK